MEKNEKMIVEEAKLFLQNNPQDPIHDLSHAFRVWENAKKIVKEEKLKDIDMDILEIICWWHDVYNPNLEKATLEKRIVKITSEYVSDKFEGLKKEKIFDSISNHEFADKPIYIEGKILQDADKLDVLSRERIEIALDSVNRGQFPKEKLISILNSLISYWIPNLLESFHFDYSKIFCEKNSEEFQVYVTEVLKELNGRDKKE